MTHREAMDILPWYVNATLANEERRAVEEHLAECAECRQELVELRAIEGAEIEIGERIRVPYPQIPELPGKVGWWLGTPLWARFTVAGQFAAVLYLAAALWYRGGGGSLGTLSGSGGEGVRIAVVFDPALTESGMRQLLLERGGTIVRGPSAQGLYTVSFPVSESEAEALLERLQHTPAIRFAERSK